MSRCQLLCILGKGGSGRDHIWWCLEGKGALCQVWDFRAFFVYWVQSRACFFFSLLAWLDCLFACLFCFVLFACLLACLFGLFSCLCRFDLFVSFVCFSCFVCWLVGLLYLIACFVGSLVGLLFLCTCFLDCVFVFYFDCSRHVCLLSLFASSHVFASFTCLFVVLWAFVFAVLIWFVWCSFRQVNVEDDSRETQGIPAFLLTNPPSLAGLSLWNKTPFPLWNSGMCTHCIEELVLFSKTMVSMDGGFSFCGDLSFHRWMSSILGVSHETFQEKNLLRGWSSCYRRGWSSNLCSVRRMIFIV